MLCSQYQRYNTRTPSTAELVLKSEGLLSSTIGAGQNIDTDTLYLSGVVNEGWADASYGWIFVVMGIIFLVYGFIKKEWTTEAP